VYGYAHFEILSEIFLVEEHVWIFEFLIEPILHLLNALHQARKVTISSQNNESRFRFPPGRRSCVRPSLGIILVGIPFVRRSVGKDI
jgi:hypothetical protein